MRGVRERVGSGVGRGGVPVPRARGWSYETGGELAAAWSYETGRSSGDERARVNLAELQEQAPKPLARRVLEDGRILELWQMMFNVRLTVTLPENVDMCWEDAWCFRDPVAAYVAIATWNGEGEPDGWIKHPPSGRARPDGTPASEYCQRDDL